MDEAIAALHPRHRDLGVGQQRRGRRPGRGHGLCRATSRRSRRWPPSTSSAATLPDLKVRVVNVVDLMRLQTEDEHPHGLPDREFDSLFTGRQADHLRLPRLPVADPPAHLPPRATTATSTSAATRRRAPTTTPFDMVMLNDLDRFHLVIDVIDRVPGIAGPGRPPAPADGRPAPGMPRLDRGSRARTRPRSATGAGRYRLPGDGHRDRRRGRRRDADPRRQRRVEQPEAAGPRRNRCHRRVGRPPGPARRHRRRGDRDRDRDVRPDPGGRPPDRPRRDPVQRPCPPGRRGRGIPPDAHRSRPAPPAQVARRARRRPGACSRTCRRSPASTPRSTPRCRPAATTYAHPARMAEALGAPQVRLPWPVARLRFATGGRDRWAGRSRSSGS